MQSIDEFRQGLDADTLVMLDRIRHVVANAHPALVESIKWNAPSYAVGDEDRITLGIERKGGVRLVLHRGAKPKDASDFQFDDIDGVARWPAPDRGVVVLKNLAAIDDKLATLTRLCCRWVEKTS